MFEIPSKYAASVISYAELDEASYAQIVQMVNHPCVEGSTIRFMPDCHAGAGCPKRMDEAGVWTSCVSESTLDESPMAYKDASAIIDTIGDTAEIVAHLKPVYNFKAN